MLCVSARFVALLGLRRPEQREQVQWPVRLHMCGGVRSKRPMAANTARGARGAGAPAVASTIAAALRLDAARQLPRAPSSQLPAAPPFGTSSVSASAECKRFGSTNVSLTIVDQPKRQRDGAAWVPWAKAAMKF